MPSPRSAGLIVAVAMLSSLLSGATSQAATDEPGVGVEASPGVSVRIGDQVRVEVGVPATGGAVPRATLRKDPKDLAELRKEAELAARDLEEATKALESRRTQVKGADKDLTAKLRELQSADQALAKVRQPLSDMVQLLYQQAGSGEIAPFLTGQSDESTLRAMSNVSQLVARQDQVVADTGQLLEGRERLAAEAQELRSGKLLAEAQMAVEIDVLRKRSDKVVKSLTQALVKLGIKIDKVGRAALGCDPTKIKSADGFPNGLIPAAYLCPLQQRGQELRADAAIAFISLNEAYRKQFGTPMCVTDSYRSLAAQQSVYYRRPGFAAVPGRSNHGLGMAVDLCGGVQISGSAQFRWLEANGKRYGWIHPKWAYSSPFEPWHWEYDPKLGSVL
ncbi:D-alanyl-D-alanine carboxypeptidase family protein [Spongiactinospora sp. TRM90649]|uniref:D-alanyl-D-alanine carboxypeptidase family protein n=1 Tax=Spongiactinospora sp. TRM90649 TaxID=3031114 RepID=UPI0023F991CF|nr:D-alanyl-D-alanine carboxypeptidase family protein [Spongiactinospora sp. TRM90649]MDF5757610.1 D-alanyl-D-alanine carboxypeptidase family protein [Spongiactinospora sp. TRM90649]